MLSHKQEFPKWKKKQPRRNFINSQDTDLVATTVVRLRGVELRARLHNGPWSRTMEDGIFPWSNFLKKSICKAFGTLTRCKLSVDQEEWPCTKK